MTPSGKRVSETLAEQYGVEADYSDPSTDDFEALSRDRIFVRSLRSDDLDAVVRIDSQNTGRDRLEYFCRKFSEVLDESGIRVSLAAELDAAVVGFVMARVDYGEFGQTDATAVFDTIGVAPAAQAHHVGRALVSQLFANLRSLQVESVRTEVEWSDFALSRFMYRCGFRPAQRLAFSQRLD